MKKGEFKMNIHAIKLILLGFFLFTTGPPGQAQQADAPLFDHLGDHYHPVTTDSDIAQQYFDQGLILAFGFNHAEAHRSFLQAATLDPDCAMAWWGAAWVLGPNINAAMDPAVAPKAWEYLQKAKSHASDLTEREQAYIRALAKRYGPEALDDRSKRDKAFAEAMHNVTKQYPEDMDAQVIYAESLMDTMPWDYWLENGEPKPDTRTVLRTLQDVLRKAPDHPMANHLMIHAVEAEHPTLGLEEAARLETLVPGAAHLVHMPAHIYIRVGEYHKATRSNLKAIQADQRYLDQVDAQSVYRLAYIPHNYHFGWATATLEGNSELAIDLAREMAETVDKESMRKRGLTTLQHYWITPLYAMVRFGRWQAILSWPEPEKDLIYPRAVWHYSRGMAFTRQENVAAARKELDRLNRLRDDPALKWVTVWDINKSRHILEIAFLALSGEIAAAERDFDSAIASLNQAVNREDALNYDEPPTWHYPTRQSLGAVLLQAGYAQKAETVYRQDLDKFPNNGWSLFGLLKALRQQGKNQKANEVERRFQKAWRHADVVLTSSRF
ncbi:hypothetical protein GF406_19535 [candidate division KSB1 bacterium]|nr:hypothetical protein [candidate division KSB1 bacterium]